MRTLFLALLMLPAQALAAPCTEESTEPCTPNSDTQKMILKAINAGITAEGLFHKAFRDRGNAQVSARASAAELASCQEKLAAAVASGDTRTVYEAKVAETKAQEQVLTAKANELEAVEIMRQQKPLMDDNFNKAIKLAQDAYHVAPTMQDPTVAAPRGASADNGAWATDMPVKWDPSFINPEEQENLFYPVQGTDGQTHYIGHNIPNAGGVTMQDGKALILPATFALAAYFSNPGILAQTIYHEASHFKELAGIGWDSYEEGELRVFRESIRTADIFELTKEGDPAGDDGYRKMFKAQLAANAGKVQNARAGTGELSGLFPDEDGEQEIKNQLDSQQRYPAETLETAFARLKDEVSTGRQALAEGHRQREAERRQLEEERQQAAQRDLIKKYKDWVAWYGFEPLMTLDGLHAEGFRAPNRCEYRFPVGGMSLDAARMAIFFADVCLEGLPPTPNNESLLAGTIDIINARWSEPEFRSRIELQVTDGKEEDCLRYMRDNSSVPMNLQAIAGLRRQFQADWQRGAIRRMNDVMERAEDARNRRRQQEREERGGSGGGDYNHCIDPGNSCLQR